MPDGAFNQWVAAKRAGCMISIVEAINTRGALLFRGDGVGTGREAITHVAFSLGNGTTIEARGAKWGVGCWTAVGRFDFAAHIPGVDYGGGNTPLIEFPQPPVPPFPGTVRKGSKGEAVRRV